MSQRKIKFMHIADTHNGYSGNASLHNEFSELKINKYNETGENIRTADINNAFAQAIDIALEENVDFVIHAGDGMNEVGYKNPAHYNFYMDQVERFSSTGRTWLEIAGNHNFSKKAGVGSELFKLGKMQNVISVFKGLYEQRTIKGLDDVVCHCLPSSYDNVTFKDELEKVKKVEEKVNILVTHCGVSSIPHYAENESSIVVYLDDLINKEMDYVALGDYHIYTDLGHNIIYPGPIEHLAFGQEKMPRVLIVEIDLETKEVTKTNKFLNVRPMIDMKEINAEGMLIEDIQEQIIKRFQSEKVEDAIVRLVIKNLPKNLKHRHLFLTDEIRKEIDRCLYFKFDFKNKVELSESVKTKDTDNEVFESLQEGLSNFIDQIPDDPNFPKRELLTFAMPYLTEVLENADN